MSVGNQRQRKRCLYEVGGRNMDARRDHDPLLFGGVAEFYKFRPPYPVELLDHIEEQYALDGRGVALDLGCDTGDSSLPFTQRSPSD